MSRGIVSWTPEHLRMEWKYFIAVGLVALVPVTLAADAARKCYQCNGCDDISGQESKACPAVGSVTEFVCSKTVTGDVTNRLCVAKATQDLTCTEAEGNALCYCDSDGCNGQTTLSPVIYMSLLSMAAALYALW